jgi:hypothetical protein
MYELVNLTLPRVVQSIDEILEDYPEHPYQSAFLIPQLRQDLIAHVLSNVPNRYAISSRYPPGVAREQPSFGKLKSSHSSPVAERLHLETVVRGSILHLLRENADWLSHRLPALNDVNKLS